MTPPASTGPLARIRHWARTLKREVIALWFAARDPATPWAARLLIALIVAYALSPIDLIPDFIPVLGFVDDALLLPALIWLALRLIPAPVLAACRARAEQWLVEDGARPKSRLGLVIVLSLWLLATLLLVAAIAR